MNFTGSPAFRHDSKAVTGVLLTNLGTPDAPDASALRRYLAQFLWDPRVVEAPRPLWWLILHGIILRVRPRRSAAAYKRVWTEQGSPLLTYTRAQATALQEVLEREFPGQAVVEFGMRYGSPAIATALQRLCERGARRLIVLPLYPQYSGPTTGSTFDAVARDFAGRRWLPDLRFVAQYHDFEPYIDALANSVRDHWLAHGKADRLLFSYHGEPRRYLDGGDPYHCQCHKTSRLLAERLDLKQEDYLTTFQSRFGREPWLQPYTDETLRALPGRGTRSVQVICPGFAADCLETLEEIGMENRRIFLDAGGTDYQYIACLNNRPDHIRALLELIRPQLENWQAGSRTPPQETARRAAGMGAGY